LTAVGDISDEAAMDSAFAELSKANWGKGVDICVQNAGYMADVSSIAEWWEGFRINVLGSFVVTRAFLRYRNTSPGADEPVRVEITSGAVVLPPAPKSSSYGASKYAQARFFEALVAEEKGFRSCRFIPEWS
jgi:NAD(P)-dependent dehydrogenase (short-subunit alcohol dehydrogenase family)